jgi:hypothetical protein
VQETWIVPRPASERVPSGVREVDVTSAPPGMAPVVSLSVTSRAKVAQIISLIDEMQTLQPGFFSCPALLEKPVVTFDFRGAASEPLLAQARLTDYGFPSGPCSPVSFSVRGHRQQPLIGGEFLTQVERLLNVRLR